MRRTAVGEEGRGAMGSKGRAIYGGPHRPLGGGGPSSNNTDVSWRSLILYRGLRTPSPQTHSSQLLPSSCRGGTMFFLKP